MAHRFANLIMENRDHDDLNGVFISMIDGQRFLYTYLGAERGKQKIACLLRATYIAEGLLARYGAANLCRVECKNGRLWFPEPNIEWLRQRYLNDPF